jgi:hypothetical protein
MYVGDSRRMGGPGLLPLRHLNFEADGFDLPMRASVLALRVQSWRMEQEQTNAYLYKGPEDIGDLNGALWWPADTRPMPMCSWVYPSLITSAAADTFMARPCEEEWGEDKRFSELEVELPPSVVERGGVPKGTEGLTVAATNEEEEFPLFFPMPTGNAVELIAVHHDGDPRLGTPVFDLKASNELDQLRMARLQSLTRVIKTPSHFQLGDTVGGSIVANFMNELAWNIGPTGQGDTFGGIVTDVRGGVNILLHQPFPGGGGGGGGSSPPFGPPGKPIPVPSVTGGDPWGEVSTHHAGPFTAGTLGCQHKLGQDADGHPINPVHIPVNALYWADQDHDAPIRFEDGWEDPSRFPFRSHAHLSHDPNGFHLDGCDRGMKGQWKFWAEVPNFVPEPPDEDEPPIIERPPPGGGDITQRQGGRLQVLKNLIRKPIGGGNPRGEPFPREGDEDERERFVPLNPDNLNPDPPASGRDASPRCAPQHKPPGKWLQDELERNPGIGISPESFLRYRLKRENEFFDNLSREELEAYNNQPLDLERQTRLPKPLQGFGGDTEPPPLGLNVLPPNAQKAFSEDDIELIEIVPASIGQGVGVSEIPDPASVAGTTMVPPQKFRTINPWEPGEKHRDYIATTVEHGGPVQLARPAQPVNGKPDLRNELSPDMRQVEYLNKTTPITGRMEAFGAKVGAEFEYTHRPGTARYMGGTGPGGWVITPPEIGIEDADTDMIREDTEVSETRVIFAPGTSCCFGPPDLETGGIKDGFELSYEGGPLTVTPVEPPTIAQPRLAFENTWLSPAAGAVSTYWPVTFNGVNYYIPLHV